MLHRVIADFLAQRYEARELVILHDANDGFDTFCRAEVERIQDSFALHSSTSTSIRIERVSAGLTLGELRNRSVDLASGELVCQWDDDDRFHPDRLAVQVDALVGADSTACYLTQQLHWFADTRELFVEDWTRESYPRNVVQGSALVRRKDMPRYPNLRRGEDTALLDALVLSGAKTARVPGKPWLFTYAFHGGNTFEREHHRAIATHKSVSAAMLLNVNAAVQRELERYVIPIDS